MNIDAPLLLHTESVQADWIDYNGHMNLAYYVLIFDHATDAFLDYIGITEKFRKANQASTFAAELHIT
ncbi:MAG: acyl-CoA thioester hydrolase, partial [Gammaproteobacteria bacterium]